MKNKLLRFVFICSSLGLISSKLIADDSKHINFLACPIVRDTTTVPCWLADHEGQTYYLGIQQDIGADWYPPQLKHQVLVEGKISDKTLCGGIVLEEIKTSVMPELDLRCNTVLPANKNFPAPHADRGPGPKNEEPGTSRRRQTAEKYNPPFATKTFSINYDFDNDQLLSREFGKLRGAIGFAQDSKAKEIQITVHRGSVLLSNGEELVESLRVVKSRALAIEQWFQLAELSNASVIKVDMEKDAEVSTGKDDWKNRRVSIRIKP